jgi:hypothetical protein
MEGLPIEKDMLELSEVFVVIHYRNFFIAGHLHAL